MIPHLFPESTEWIIALSFYVLWPLLIFRNIFRYVYYWQLKEYRWDRMKDFFVSASNRIFVLTIIIKLILFIVLFFYITFFFELSRKSAKIFFMIYPLYLIASFIWNVFEIKKRGLLRPKFTKKALLIMGILLFPIVVIEFIGFDFGKQDIFLFMMYDFGLFAAVSFIIFLFWPLTLLGKKHFLKKAAQKIQENKHLKVIGITGSYGKSSTKEFLATILSKKFRLLKTPKNINTEIGIARFILKQDLKKYEVFIVEMGAYKRGEIKKICSMVKPKIGILTGINEQHLSLFGSLENTIKTKFELIDSLPGSGIAILNGDNTYILDRFDDIKQKQKYLYSKKSEADIYADRIQSEIDGLSFALHYKKGVFNAKVPLLGEFHVSNLLPAVLVALFLKIHLGEIKEALIDIKSVPKTMEPKLLKEKNLLFVDDSYNANPDGVLEALEYLKNVSGVKKVFVFSTMLELGKKAKEKHRKVAEKTFDVADYVVIFKSEFADEFQKTAISANFPKDHYYIGNDLESILKFLKKHAGKNAVILFESRGVEKILNKILDFTHSGTSRF